MDENIVNISNSKNVGLPLVSILIPVYNCEKFIRETIESVLSQTYEKIEVIIINDGSTDNTENVILSFQDSRIKYFKNTKNQKLIETLNIGLDYCNGKYIARIDADDIALPERIEKQVLFLENNQECVVLGTSAYIINHDGISVDNLTYHCKSNDISFLMAFYCPVIHPSVLIRSDIIRTNNLKFDKEYLHAEDYEFWTRISKFGEISNLEIPLIKYRTHSSQISKLNQVFQIEQQKKIAKKYARLKLVNFNDYELDFLFEYEDSKLSFHDKLNSLIKFQRDYILECSLKNKYLLTKFKNLVLESDSITLLGIFTVFSSKLFFKNKWTIKQIIGILFKLLK